MYALIRRIKNKNFWKILNQHFKVGDPKFT